MNDLDDSARRLDEALSRLESAVGERNVRVELAEAEQARLVKELAELRADFERLKMTSSGVSERLDSAIGRLKIVLEDGA